MGRRVWVTADTHFGDEDAIARFGRPFPDVHAMDEALLEAINLRVGRRDVLLHLGDRGHKPQRALAMYSSTTCASTVSGTSPVRSRTL